MTRAAAIELHVAEVMVPLRSATITARGSFAAQRVSFLVRMSPGRTIVATREKSVPDGAVLHVTYCR